MKEKISKLTTEKSNPKSSRLDSLSAFEIVKLMNEEDRAVASSIVSCLPAVAAFVEEAAIRFRKGGRLFYVGAGTSGRLGILDASECPPTFGTPREWVQGVIAGGTKAIFSAVEGAEDQEAQGAADLRKKKFRATDCVVGLSASGRTPYVLGALKYAKKMKAATAAISCNPDAKMVKFADFKIVPGVGPEIISGSTRLKCGTAQKMLLNMISTALMVKLGRVKGNQMIDLIPKSEKLWERAKAIVMESLNVGEKHAGQLLKQANGAIRTALKLHNTKF